MSAPPLSKLLRFLLVAAGLIIILSVLWSFFESSYSDFLTIVARSTVSRGVTVSQQGGTIVFTRIEYKSGFQREVKDSIHVPAIQFGLLLTLSLVAATPGLALAKRFLYSGIALAAIVLFQILAVVIMARTFFNIFFVVVSDLLPPVLWALFSLKYWFAPRNAPLPKT